MTAPQGHSDPPGLGLPVLARCLGWSLLAVLAVFLLNNCLNFGPGWPGAGPVFGSDSATLLSWVQLGFYAAGIAVALAYVLRSPATPLRADAVRIAGVNNYIIRGAFWAILFVGLADMVVSFLRVEDLLEPVVGEELTKMLGRPRTRGPYLHLPLIALGFVVATFTRTLGFTWLALLVVVAELQIVLARFIFSYEQAFMGDLVRFWYAALFLLASAYTLWEEGHVRVDVLYAGMTSKTKGLVNALGTPLLGVTFCWSILLVGMGGKSAIINSPLLNFEVSQSGFGMYVKYLMAGFLGLFAISMMIQFVSYFLDAVADYRGDPGGRNHHEAAVP